ncbi:hypothetical protein KFE25_006761 [Diacronema lutheri]|uniref:Uncharacterized protein n=1 Tax=Diacronema lutheri TaxID=2081491 RepID=A0A8J6CCM2_DIALT|nr:hypothetical protein KFE25_006761 [Diacronema lutheri]
MADAIDDIFMSLSRPARDSVAAPAPARGSATASPGGRAIRGVASAARHAGAPRARSVSPAHAALSVGGGNAFQRKADEALPTRSSVPSAKLCSAGKRKRERPSTANDRPFAHRDGAAPADGGSAGSVAPRPRAPREPAWPIDISDATLAQAADGTLTRLAAGANATLARARGSGGGSAPPALNTSSARLVLLSGVPLGSSAAERKLALDALLVELAPFAPLHAHVLADWATSQRADPDDGGGKGGQRGCALAMLALELNEPMAAALLLAASEQLAGGALAATSAHVGRNHTTPAPVAAARALIRAHPAMNVGDGCERLSDEAMALIAAAGSDPRHATLARAKPSAHELLQLAVSATTASEASALIALAAETAATAKGGGGEGEGEAAARAQLVRLCARHRQGKAAICAGVAVHATPAPGHASLAPFAMAFSYCGRVRARALPHGRALALLELLDAHDWAATGNNRNPTGRREGIQVDGAFSLGVGTARLSPAAAACPGGALAPSAPFNVPCAFREGVGLQRGEAARKRHSALWAAAIALLREVDPDYVPTSIGFNRNFRGSPHRDEKDAGPQVATALSAALRGGRGYDGGALRVYTPLGAVDVDTQNGWCRFDGRYRHEVMPFRPAASPKKGKERSAERGGGDGVRYSVIFYQLTPPFALDMSTVESDAPIAEQARAVRCPP